MKIKYYSFSDTHENEARKAKFSWLGQPEGQVHGCTKQMTEFKGQAISYDNNGNMIFDGIRTYKYDAFNRIIEVKVSSVVLAEYSYDAFNRRVMKKVDADLNSSFETTVKFFYDGFRCIEELDASDALTKEYVYGSLYIDEVILQRTGATDYYFTHDYRYSVTSLTNSSGGIVESYDYKVYGERTCSGSGLTDVGYTGQRHDSESGLMYFKNRYYSTSMGQFVTRDPKEYIDGMSMYLGYFGGMGVDPMGLEIPDQPLQPGRGDPGYETYHIGIKKVRVGFIGAEDIFSGKQHQNLEAIYNRYGAKVIRSRGMSTAENLIKKEYKKHKKLFGNCIKFEAQIMGYSWGGWSALRLVNDFANDKKYKDIKFRLGLLDPVPHGFTKSASKALAKWVGLSVPLGVSAMEIYETVGFGRYNIGVGPITIPGSRFAGVNVPNANPNNNETENISIDVTNEEVFDSRTGRFEQLDHGSLGLADPNTFNNNIKSGGNLSQYAEKVAAFTYR